MWTIEPFQMTARLHRPDSTDEQNDKRVERLSSIKNALSFGGI